MENEPDDQTEALLRAAMHASRAMVSASMRHVSIGLPSMTVPEYHMLVILTVSGASRPSEMLRKMNVSKATTTRVADRLVRKGLAEKCPDPDDGRSVLVMLSDTGMDLVTTLMNERRETFSRIVQGMSREEKAILTRALEEFARASGEPQTMLWV